MDIQKRKSMQMHGEGKINYSIASGN